MARPTVITEEMLEKAREYPEKFAEHGHAFPSVVGLCKVLGVARQTIYNRSAVEEDDPDPDPMAVELLDIVNEINESQEFELTDKGIRGSFNPTICKLMLGKHGYHDKQELGNFEGEDLTIEVEYV